MANLKELAEILGLSQTTVSRALNGYPEVSEKTRERVMKAAREHDYVPNSNAQRLATGKARTIGHVVPISSHDMINPHFSDFIAGAGLIYNRRGYDMLIALAEVKDEIETYRELKRDNRVDGVIVHGPLVDDRRVQALLEINIPFVVHGRTLDDPSTYSWVDVNNKRTFAKAAEHLINLGHRDIALINGLENMMFAHRRRVGYEEALTNAGIALRPELMTSNDMTETDGHEHMSQFLDMDQAPTGVLCSSILSAMGALRAIRERGLKPGKDVSVIAFDDCLKFLGTGKGEMNLSVTRSSIRYAGDLCANMLIDLIEGDQTPRNILLEAEFIQGETTGPAPR